MNKLNCPHFELGCDAPLCPIHPSVVNSIWYPDEEVCKRRNAPDWVKKQRRTVKAKSPPDRFFTIAMLEAVHQIRPGIEGLNPDVPIDQSAVREQNWISKRKPVSPKEACITRLD